jgi:hypothetical protein
VQILADDKMEGRNTGSEGYRKAAAYVAGEFEKVGLKPAGVSGFYQPIEFRVRQIQEAQSEIELVQDGKSKRLSLSRNDSLEKVSTIWRACVYAKNPGSYASIGGAPNGASKY